MKNINVVFLGGSITWGAGADNYEDSWAFRTGEYLKEMFYGRNVNCYNVGISGTGSRLGVFRLQEQVLALNPDILFYEFAVNDYWESVANENDILAAMEYNIRMLMKQNPSIRIILILSARKGYETAAPTHRKIAAHYGLPVIDCQAAVKCRLKDNLDRWNELLADDVHPSSEGHALYFETIRQYLEENRSTVFLKDLILPEPLVEQVYYQPVIADAQECLAGQPGWQLAEYEDCKRSDAANVNEMMLAEEPGTTAAFDFVGSTFGIYHLVRSDCGRLEIQIDGRPKETLECYYNCGGDFVSFYNKYRLPFGKHHVSLKISEERHPAATGYKVGITGFLID